MMGRILLISTVLATPLLGQGMVRGRTVRDAGGQVLPGVEVLISPGAHVVTTGPEGTFQLTGISAGRYHFIARRIGYRPVRLDFALKSGDTVDIMARLPPGPQLLDSLIAEGTIQPRSSGLRDMEQRRRIGIGKFMTTGVLRDLEGRSSLTEVLRRWGVHIEWDDHGRLMAASTRGPTRFSLRACHLQIFQDGVPVDSKALDLRGVPLSSLGGIEYYAGPAQTPLVFERENASCGVLVLWTRER